MHEVIECAEFEELSVRAGTLLENGELRLDERISSRGYLAAAIKGGEIKLRSTRFVGLIPLTNGVSVRVKPRFEIGNLSYMLVRSGAAPTAVSGFARGYMPRFAAAGDVEKIYAKSLVEGVRLVARRGYMKEYVRPENPAPWRGRLMPSETVRRHASKGVRYRHEFDHRTLSFATVENIALREALSQVRSWFLANARRDPILPDIDRLLAGMAAVPAWSGRRADLVGALANRIRSLTPRMFHYQDPLWSAYVILQGVLPDVGLEGHVRLDSLIVDVSMVFEAYVRRELRERLAPLGLRVEDGNVKSERFFRDARQFSVHPDIVIRREGAVVAVIDAKYKPDPKEQDRYELLAFMDAMGVTVGALVCPSHGGDRSQYLGVTATGKQMFSLRIDLGSSAPEAEADRFAANVVRMIEGRRDFA